MDMQAAADRGKFMKRYYASLEAELAEAEREYAAQQAQIKIGRRKNALDHLMALIASLLSAVLQ